MKIKNKILLLSLFGLKIITAEQVNLIEAQSFTKKLIVDVDDNFVNTVVESISEDKYKKLANAIITDVQKLIAKLQLLSNRDTMYPMNLTTKESLINAYKENIAAIYSAQKNPIFSQETYAKILYWLFYFGHTFLASENANFIKESEPFNNLFMIANLFGIEFTSKTYFNDIFYEINNYCHFLKNNDLNNITYEITIKKVLEATAKKFIEINTDFFNDLMYIASYQGLQKMLNKIEELSTEKVNKKTIINSKKKK